MRLAIDADLVGKDGSGNETYIRGMCSGFAACLDPKKDRILLCGSDPKDLESINVGAIQKELIVVPSGLRGDLYLGHSLNNARADIFLASYNAPLHFKGKSVTAVHDVSYLILPETYPLLLRTRIRLSVYRSVRVSERIATLTEFSKSEILRIYPRIDPEHVVITEAAAGPEFSRSRISDEMISAVRAKYSLPDRFILAVGNIQPRKNIPRLIRACQNIDAPLILVGQKKWLNKADDFDQSPNVRWIGYIPTFELPAIYAACSIFVYPSLYEGFGLPVIEAMAAGSPVATSAGTSMEEIAGGAAELFRPDLESEIETAIWQVLSDPLHAESLSKAGQSRAKQFSWEQSATRLLESVS